MEEVAFEIGFEIWIGLHQKEMGQKGQSNGRISTEILVAQIYINTYRMVSSSNRKPQRLHTRKTNERQVVKAY